MHTRHWLAPIIMAMLLLLQVAPFRAGAPLAAGRQATCTSALNRLCGGAPTEVGCKLCAGTHQHQLRAADCASSDCDAFCAARFTCRVQAGTVCKQPRHYDEVEAADAGVCCTLCGEDRRCQFWTFKPSDVGSGHPCQRFASLPAVNKSSGDFISGSAPDVRPSPPAPPPASKMRLRVSGANLTDPDGKPMRLVGFNWQLQHVQSAPFDDGALMKSLLPGANLVRLVGVLWDNKLGDDGKLLGNDCMTETPPYFKDSCFDKLDNAVRQATRSKIWVVLAARAQTAAGQNFDTAPSQNVFHNATLRTMFFTMWKHVAAHYSTWDYIGAYEVMAEPRDKDVLPFQVREFYSGACDAVQSIEPGTPCVMGPAPYYKLWRFDDSILLTSTNRNVIYTFDYFEPADYVMPKKPPEGKPSISPVPQYLANYSCVDLIGPWAYGAWPTNTSQPACANNATPTAQVGFDATWHAANFGHWAAALRDRAQVPVFLNQWTVHHGVTAEQGRFAYMSDVARELRRLEIGWAWWVWRGSGGAGFPKYGSSGFVWGTGSEAEVDREAIAAVQPYT